MGLQTKQQGIPESCDTNRNAKYVFHIDFTLDWDLRQELLQSPLHFGVHFIFFDDDDAVSWWKADDSIRMWRTTNGSTRLEIVEIWLSVLFLFVFLLLFCHKLCQSDNLESYFDDDDVYWFISFDINPSIAIIKVWSTKLLRNSRMQLSDVP